MGIIRARFWTNTAGRALRQLPAEVRELMLYLHTCDEADEEPFGLYKLDVDKAVMLLGRDKSVVQAGLTGLEQLQLVHFDPETTWIFVREHAALQVPKLPLSLGDMKCRAARLWYRRLPLNPWLGEWWDKYGDDFNLAFEPHAVRRRDWTEPDAPEVGLAVQETGEFALVPLDVLPQPFDKAASFERIVAAYPNPSNLKRAKVNYYLLPVGPQLEAEILDGIARWRQSTTWMEEGGKWIPGLQNFIRDQRWKDRPRLKTHAHLNSNTISELEAGHRFAESLQHRPRK